MFNRGVNETTQKCHNSIAPTLQQGASMSTQKCHSSDAPALQQGAVGTAQKCHQSSAPALFWRHHKFAEMPALDRANGKGH